MKISTFLVYFVPGMLATGPSAYAWEFPFLNSPAKPTECVPAEEKVTGLLLSLPAGEVEHGTWLKLQWEIIPDTHSSVSIILALILPDGSFCYYAGPGIGLNSCPAIDDAKPVITDFPYNTPMKGSMRIYVPAEFPGGTYRFAAFVRDGEKVIDVAYSDPFTLSSLE